VTTTKSKAAQQLGALGGAARARVLSAARRSEIATAAARARWGAKRKGGKK
jgi:hypothetical protein